MARHLRPGAVLGCCTLLSAAAQILDIVSLLCLQPYHSTTTKLFSICFTLLTSMQSKPKIKMTPCLIEYCTAARSCARLALMYTRTGRPKAGATHYALQCKPQCEVQDAVVHSMRFWGAYQRHGERAILRGRGNIAVAPTWLEATTLRNLFWAPSLFDHLLKRYHNNLLSVLTSQLDASKRRAGEEPHLLQLLNAVPFADVAMQEAAAAQGTTVAAALAQPCESALRQDSRGRLQDTPEETPRQRQHWRHAVSRQWRRWLRPGRSRGNSPVHSAHLQHRECSDGVAVLVPDARGTQGRQDVESLHQWRVEPQSGSADGEG